MSGKEKKRSLQNEMFIEIWNLLFARRFGFKADFSKIVLPPAKDGRVLPIFMPRQLARGKVGFINRIFGVCKESFPCYSYYDDLDAAISHNDRTPKNGSYAICIGSHLEATDGDPELKDLSANVIWERGLPTLGLPERLMQELYVWHTMGRHLDARDVTLCAGSRDSDGDVPRICWGAAAGSGSTATVPAATAMAFVPAPQSFNPFHFPLVPFIPISPLRNRDFFVKMIT